MKLREKQADRNKQEKQAGQEMHEPYSHVRQAGLRVQVRWAGQNNQVKQVDPVEQVKQAGMSGDVKKAGLPWATNNEFKVKNKAWSNWLENGSNDPWVTRNRMREEGPERLKLRPHLLTRKIR